MKTDENDIFAMSVLPIVKTIYTFFLMLAFNSKLFICTILAFVVLDINTFSKMHTVVLYVWQPNEC